MADIFNATLIHADYIHGVKFTQTVPKMSMIFKMYEFIYSREIALTKSLIRLSRDFQEVSTADLKELHSLSAADLDILAPVSLQKFVDLNVLVDAVTFESLLKVGIRYGKFYVFW